MTTIQTIGKAPNTMPMTPEFSAMPTGMFQPKMATRIATAKEPRPATWALVLMTARRMKKVSSGTSATSAEMATLPAMGSVVGVNTVWASLLVMV